LDKAYSDRIKPVEREPEEKPSRHDRRRGRHDSIDDDRWGSHPGGVPELKHNFISGGVQKPM
jgi:hypothetical protein